MVCDGTVALYNQQFGGNSVGLDGTFLLMPIMIANRPHRPNHTSPEIRVFDWRLLDLMCEEVATTGKQFLGKEWYQATSQSVAPVAFMSCWFHPWFSSAHAGSRVLQYPAFDGWAAQGTLLKFFQSHPNLQAKHFNSRFTEKMPHGFAWHGTIDKDPSKVCMLLC